jgi:uncharacterized protein YndB with AHSA1/START domain
MKPFESSFQTTANKKQALEALTTPAGIQAWWCKDSDIAESVGQSHHMRFDKQGTLVNMHFKVDKITDSEVAWTCTKNDNPVWVGSTLVWTIEESGSETTVHFVHDGFNAGGPPYEATMEGWVMFMKSLKSVMDGGKGTPF